MFEINSTSRHRDAYRAAHAHRGAAFRELLRAFRAR